VSDRRALLDAIIADPDDDAVRLVYADWLDENGSEADRARARLIRLQIELERVEDDDRCRVIARECAALIDRHWREWSRGFQADQRDAVHFMDVFKRGFVPWVEMKGQEFLSDPTLDDLLGCEPITRLVISVHRSLPAAIAHWKHLHRVRELVLLSCEVHDAAALLQSPALTNLREFVALGVIDEASAALIASDARFAHIGRLNLGHTVFRGLGARALGLIAHSRTLSRLTALDYGWNDTTIDAVDSLAASPLAGRLTFLGLGRDEYGDFNPVPTLGARVVERLVGFPRLEGLDLGGQQIGDDGAEMLARCPNLAGLKRLDLASNCLGARGIAALLSSPYLTRLEELDLSDNRPGVAWIARLLSDGTRRFRSLRLNVNDLDEEAATLLANAAACEGVQELTLMGNSIGDRGVIALARSAHLPQLRRLNLRGCSIGDAGVLALAESPLMDRLACFRGLRMSDPYGKEAERRLLARLGYDPMRYGFS
jgi:uncharacterized protein (TIGR02996 family)